MGKAHENLRLGQRHYFTCPRDSRHLSRLGKEIPTKSLTNWRTRKWRRTTFSRSRTGQCLNDNITASSIRFSISVSLHAFQMEIFHRHAMRSVMEYHKGGGLMHLYSAGLFGPSFGKHGLLRQLSFAQSSTKGDVWTLGSLSVGMMLTLRSFAPLQTSNPTASLCNLS